MMKNDDPTFHLLKRYTREWREAEEELEHRRKIRDEEIQRLLNSPGSTITRYRIAKVTGMTEAGIHFIANRVENDN